MTEAEQERAAVCAWLRRGAVIDRELMFRAGARGDWKAALALQEESKRDSMLANAIERGEHLAKEREA